MARQLKNQYLNKSAVWTILEMSGQSGRRSGMWLKEERRECGVRNWYHRWKNPACSPLMKDGSPHMQLTCPKHNIYTVNHKGLQYDRKTRINVTDFREIRGQIRKKKADRWCLNIYAYGRYTSRALFLICSIKFSCQTRILHPSAVLTTKMF